MTGHTAWTSFALLAPVEHGSPASPWSIALVLALALAAAVVASLVLVSRHRGRDRPLRLEGRTGRRDRERRGVVADADRRRLAPAPGRGWSLDLSPEEKGSDDDPERTVTHTSPTARLVVDVDRPGADPSADDHGRSAGLRAAAARGLGLRRP